MLAGRDVLDMGDGVPGVAVTPDHRGGHADPDDAAVRPDQSDLTLHAFAPGRRETDDLHPPRVAIGGVGHLPALDAEQLSLRETGECAQRRVHPDHVPATRRLEADQGGTHRRTVERLAETRLALGERPLGRPMPSSGLGTRDGTTHRRGESGEAVLDEIVGGAGTHAGDRDLLGQGVGDDQQWDVRGAGVQAVQDVDRGVSRQVVVTDHGVRTAARPRREDLPHRREGLHPRGLAGHPAPAQLPQDQLGVIGGVFDHEEL